MQDYHLDHHLSTLRQEVPRKERKPLIGITANYAGGDASLRERYYKQIVEAGAIPLILPPVADIDVIEDTLSAIDGLLLTGGADINPLWMGEEPQPALGNVNAERDLPELLLTRRAFERQMPILGICRGVQTLAVALGGHVAQDIASLSAIKHSQTADRTETTHSVDIITGSTLHSLYNTGRLAVNSFHHQAVDQPGPRFRTTATAPDGIIEAIESNEHKPVMGVQWHPEWLGDEGQPLFRWLADEAARFAQVKHLHTSILTLDSHCDTPMFFPQHVDFARRDDRILVDLHKMTDGMLDAVTMVAYLPQDDPAPPRAYADNIFSEVEDIVRRCPSHVAIARTVDDLRHNKQAGLKSIILGIENGKALEGQVENISHFARRGITYITLCHNGDNDICDSARGRQTWGGLSPLGREVVREMNRQGILVDLSHAAESSFYEALELSATPIVCSHSNCRALCDHPRNLTDDQMQRLAQAGGVMQITLYNGFLRTDGQATIDDVLRHLEHAISVIGIDHVGIGTDFDGDGGICGLADASELPNLTRELLRRGYQKDDIGKIWGRNWLRVLNQAQHLTTTPPTLP